MFNRRDHTNDENEYERDRTLFRQRFKTNVEGFEKEEPNELISTNCFHDLSLTSASARRTGLQRRQLVPVVQGRLKVRRPEKVNMMLHKLAVDQMKLEEHAYALNRPIERWIEMGGIIWKERREMIFKNRIRGKTKPEDTGNTLEDLNSPSTEVIDKLKGGTIKTKFLNQSTSRIGNVKGQTMCYKCRDRFAYKEYSEWGK